MNRITDIKEYRQQGLSWRNIGEKLGVSGQASYMYYQRHVTPHKIRVKYQKQDNHPQKIYINREQLSERKLLDI